MSRGSHLLAGVVIVIPAWNEEITIGEVVREMRAAGSEGVPASRTGPAALPEQPPIPVVVGDNGSTDRTAVEATAAGAIVVDAPRRGYGSACLAGLAWCRKQTPRPRVVVFADGDGSDDPAAFLSLVEPVLRGDADLVIGSRVLGKRETGSVLPQARIGNWIAATWMRWVSGVRFTDLGPYRAISWEALERLGMSDPNWGWTVEMQLKAARAGLRCMEVPVRSRRRRGGESKVTGTVRGTFGASVKILWSLARYSRWQG